jgi:methyl-CpG-binding domain protein 4
MIREELFSLYPDADSMRNSDPERLAILLKPLGFYNRRSKTLIKFSDEWITKDWQHPRELHGIGEYAAASWDIFYEHRLDVEPTDGVLVKYLQWKRHQSEHYTPISES